MQNTKDLLKNETQSPSAYSTLSGKEAKDYMIGLGSSKETVRDIKAVHIIFGNTTSDLPENIARSLPKSPNDRLEDLRQNKIGDTVGTWLRDNDRTRTPNSDATGDHIIAENLANMFTTSTNIFIDRGTSSGIHNSFDQIKRDVTSGKTYVDMFASAVNILHTNRILSNDQREEIFAKKIEAIRSNPTSIFNFRFDGSLPIDQLQNVDTPAAKTLLALSKQWDNAQAEAVQIIGNSNNNKVRIAGLLGDGTPGAVVDAAVATAESKKDDVNKLVQWSKEIPTDVVFEAATNFSQLDENLRDKVDSIVKSQRNWKSLKGEKDILGDYNGYTKDGMKLLLAVIKLDSFDIFDANLNERAVLNQKLEAWTAITHPDKRNSIDGLKPLLASNRGVDVLDRIQSISAYLLSISRQAGKDQK